MVFEHLHYEPEYFFLCELHLQQKGYYEIHPLAVPYIRVANGKVPQYPTQRLPLLYLRLPNRPDNILLYGIMKILRIQLLLL